MEIAAVLAILAGLALGIVIGTGVRRAKTKPDVIGRLRIDHSEPDEPTRMFAELKGVTPDMIAKKKYVVFEVINENYISHN